MEPLAALGLAGNVVQFIDFALKFIGTVSEITASAGGASKKTLELETVYERLQHFTAVLSQTNGHAGSQGNAGTNTGHQVFSGGLHHHNNTAMRAMDSHAKAIEAMAGECQDVCDRLLALFNSLRPKPNKSGKAGSWIKASVAALKTVFAEKKIAEMEESLKRFQRMIGLHFLPLIDAKQSYLLSILMDIKSDTHGSSRNYTAKLGNIQDGLKKIQQSLSSRSDLRPRNDTFWTPESHKGTTAAAAVTSAHHSGLKDLEEVLSRLTLTEKDINAIAKEQYFVRSLYFSDYLNRYEDIPAAHAATFRWMFDDAAPHHHGVAANESVAPVTSGLLLRWLRSGSGTFWVTGKPGSGKSTFMKFVAGHEKTRKSLEKWAKPNNVVIAKHYFWNAGTAMQKSIKGLLQSLLYTVLRCQPDLASVIFPNQWHQLEQKSPFSEIYWTIEEMRAGLEALARHPAMPTKFCFFIDGLDEFDGNYEDEYMGLCKLLQNISLSPHLKCCVSSRPWNVFVDTFSQKPASTLYMHEVTFQDILGYTTSRLTSHPRWKMLDVPSDEAESIISSITERAKGVFLWVFLVTRSLRSGLTNSDTIKDLQRRLDSLPTEIESFYKHMLDLTEPTDHRYMTRTLQIAIEAEDEYLLTYYTRELEDMNSNYALEQPVNLDIMLPAIPEEHLEPCRRRINARCGGLLECNDNRVGFIHRTARDFIITDPMQGYLHQKAGGERYDTNMALLKVRAYLYRCFLASSVYIQKGRSAKLFFQVCLLFAKKAFEKNEESVLELLSTVSDTPEDRALRDPSSVREALLSSEASKTPIRAGSTALKNGTMSEHFLLGPYMQRYFFSRGFHEYIIVRLKRDPSFFRNMQVSPLGIRNEIDRHGSSEFIIKRALLNTGYDANEPIGESTAWHCLISEYLDEGLQGTLQPLGGESLISLYLRKGAHRTQRMKHGDDDTMLFPLTHILMHLFKFDYSKKYIPTEHFTAAVDVFLSGTESETTMQLNEVIAHFSLMLRSPCDTRSMPLRRAAIETIIRKANSVRVGMQSLTADILNYFGAREGASIVSLISKGPWEETGISDEQSILLQQQENMRPTASSSKTPKRLQQDQPDDTEHSPKRSKRIRGQGPKQNKGITAASGGRIEVIEILD